MDGFRNRRCEDDEEEDDKRNQKKCLDRDQHT